MYAMQYEITLPADYSMDVIRKRVAERGHLTDGFEGLGLKAYLVRERGADGSPVNQYAPFYLWDDTGGMNRFLWGGGGFDGIVASFGRPEVRHWTGVAFRTGPDAAGEPRAAVRRTVRLPAGADPAGVVPAAAEALEERARRAGVHSTALAVDPTRWELVEFTLHTDEPAAPTDPDTALYRVLHLSRPHFAELPLGRQW
ncbi:DUF4865 domain-containing protein [Mangrovactinospora gilvigrisea]|uniref:DUF4865 domain-containing protein n=1 Tax=Mangrovactinospora gilvigrisea TaxID=1428644 RepID=A0A1J7BAL3_9ACTN|nr:DUF4865 family protein [Mangrovactinospora gilvigrisea]OIV35735.1 DUF4865 domain-containing protein [Mangrovactinospora gilvigrisea]